MSDVRTATWRQQHDLELTVAGLYQTLLPLDADEREGMLPLLRERHVRYLQGALGSLPGGFAALGASRPWICYWALNGLALLGAGLPSDLLTPGDVICFLSSCQDARGGYGGGPGQLPHLAPTYAAVSALVTLGTPEALGSIDRPAMQGFLLRLALPSEQGGGFVMHDGGECDVRACYCALAIATHLQLDLQPLLERSGCVDYIRRCQTYEGGLGGEPGNEAHGGYTFCGLAALTLAGATHVVDLPRLLHWAVYRQAWVEGGFNGRTNKLADGCYSFWQGGLFPLLQRLGPSALLRTPPLVPPEAAGAGGPDDTGDLGVPLLPPLHRVCGPLEQAERVARARNEAAEALVEAAISTPAAQRDGAADAAAAATGADAASDEQPTTRGQGAGPPSLLERAASAQQAAEAADDEVQIARSSAAVLFPAPLCPAPSSPPNQGAGGAGAGGAGASGAAAAADAADGGASASDAAAGPPPNPLMNNEALQLWILHACQQVKGGLRDKPGKHADYYHSCYCLAGLAAAQQQPGGRVVGPFSNELARMNPVLNVLEERAAAARAFFGDAP